MDYADAPIAVLRKGPDILLSAGRNIEILACTDAALAGELYNPQKIELVFRQHLLISPFIDRTWA